MSLLCVSLGLITGGVGNVTWSPGNQTEAACGSDESILKELGTKFLVPGVGP